MLCQSLHGSALDPAEDDIFLLVPDIIGGKIFTGHQIQFGIDEMIIFIRFIPADDFIH